MSKPFRELLDEVPQERRDRIAVKTEILKNEMASRKMRQALDLTQEELARSLNMEQTAASRVERQSDIYLGTLRKTLSAMGGDLRITVHFSEGDVPINRLADVRASAEPPVAARAATPRPGKPSPSP